MIYCDTSLLVAALTSETHSIVAQKWLSANAGEQLAISDWVMTEFASALAMKARRGVIDAIDRRDLEHNWQTIVAATFIVLPVTTVHFTTAATLVDAGHAGLRAGDALHLAISLGSDAVLATLDNDLADAARTLSILADMNST